VPAAFAPIKPKVQQTGGFFDLSVPRLKILAKMRGVNIQSCTEKDDMVAALKAANVPESAMKIFKDSAAAKEDAAVAAANSAATAEAAVRAGAEKAAWKVVNEPAAPKVIAPPKKVPLTQEELWEQQELQEKRAAARGAEIYEKYRSLFQIGAMFDLLTNICLWKNQWGKERIFFLNALAPNGWANTVEVMEHGATRMKLRGMVYDIRSNTMKGNSSQVGWVDITALVDDFTGEVFLKPHDLTYQKKINPGAKAAPRAAQNQPVSTQNRWNRFKADGSGETAVLEPSKTGKQVNADAEEY
jgi:hypothetical protein